MLASETDFVLESFFPEKIEEEVPVTPYPLS